MRSSSKPLCSYVDRRVLLDRALGFSKSLSLITKNHIGTHPNRGERALFLLFFSSENCTTRRLLSARNLLICFPKEGPQTGKEEQNRGGQTRKDFPPPEAREEACQCTRSGVLACKKQKQKHTRERSPLWTLRADKECKDLALKNVVKSLRKTGLRTSYCVQRNRQRAAAKRQ